MLGSSSPGLTTQRRKRCSTGSASGWPRRACRSRGVFCPSRGCIRCGGRIRSRGMTGESPKSPISAMRPWLRRYGRQVRSATCSRPRRGDCTDGWWATTRCSISTYYASTAQPATNPFGIVLSWTTSTAVGRGNGWSALELAAIEELSGTLALAIKGNTAPAAAHDLLAAYLGGDAADRVSAGQVQRGTVSRIAAAILCADVRGFTNFAEETGPEEVTRRLNGIFDCVGDPVRAAGGEILKFLGDGVLAVFLPPDGANVAIVTPAALAAAREILARVEALNTTETAAGNPALSLNIALHAGEVTYGNIGTADRLDFTVIGPAVNEAARLEGLCKVLGKPILISKSFVQAAEGVREPLLSVGRHPLRGVREAQEVFTIYT